MERRDGGWVGAVAGDVAKGAAAAERAQAANGALGNAAKVLSSEKASRLRSGSDDGLGQPGVEGSWEVWLGLIDGQ